MKFIKFFNTRRSILLALLFWAVGAVLCFAGAAMAGFHTESLSLKEAVPWYQTVRFDSNGSLELGVAFEGEGFLGLGF